MIQELSPEHLQIREGGGGAAFLGLPFFCAGLFIIGMVFRIIPLQNASDIPEWAWPLLFVMGTAFLGAGAWLVLGRTWVDIDRSRGTVEKSWGFLRPMNTRSHFLMNYQSVSVQLETDAEGPDTYPVVLKHREGGPKLKLFSTQQYGQSVEGALRVAKFLKIPLEDRVTDHPKIIPQDPRGGAVEPGRSENEIPAERPSNTRCAVEESGGGVRIVIPNRRFEFSRFFLMAFFWVAFFDLRPEAHRFFRQTGTPPYVEDVIMSVAAFLFLAVPLFGVIGSFAQWMRGRVIVTAGPDGVTIERVSGWGRHKTGIPAADLWDIDYSTAESAYARGVEGAEARGPVSSDDINLRTERWAKYFRRFVPAKGVILKSKRGLVSFGTGLSEKEIFYLYGRIKTALGK